MRTPPPLDHAPRLTAGHCHCALDRIASLWLFTVPLCRPLYVAPSRSALELKGQYLGQTGPRVKDAVADAMGGCLFLDEAYALAGNRDGHGADSYGGEAVRTLLTEVQQRRHRFEDPPNFSARSHPTRAV